MAHRLGRAACPRSFTFTSKSTRTAHRAVITWLASRLHRTGLLFFKEVNQLRHRRFIDAEPLLARMRRRDVDAAEPRRTRERGWSGRRALLLRRARLFAASSRLCY